MKSEFYTMKGYEKIDEKSVSSSMEDYLEMIVRMHKNGEPLRISTLAERLHVKPSSASKMAVNLKDAGFINFEKYGSISLCGRGAEMGEYLLYRHDVVHNFLKLLNGRGDETEQAEKIEHFLDETTVRNLEWLAENMIIFKEKFNMSKNSKKTEKDIDTKNKE